MKKFLDWVFDPLGVRKDINKLTSKMSEFQGCISHSASTTSTLAERLLKLDEHIKEHTLLSQVNKALDGAVPDMFWVKDLQGKYLMANRAIRENLLFSDNPIGKTDRELAQAIVDRVGAERHNFGAICANSDDLVIQAGRPMKFNEDGIINGEYKMLQVHKNVVHDEKGKVIATCGVGRDITREVDVIQSIKSNENCNSCGKIHTEIGHILDMYKFEDRT